MTTNQTTMAPGTTLNTKSATDKTETETPVTTDAKQITMAPGTTSTTKSTTVKTGTETPVATDANQIITAPGTSSTRKSPTDQMEAGTSDAPDATISPKSTEGIRSTKTSTKAPTPKDQSSGAPTDKVKPSPNHSYTGAIVGLFIFLVATGVLFVAIYLVRRQVPFFSGTLSIQSLTAQVLNFVIILTGKSMCKLIVECFSLGISKG